MISVRRRLRDATINFMNVCGGSEELEPLGPSSKPTTDIGWRVRAAEPPVVRVRSAKKKPVKISVRFSFTLERSSDCCIPIVLT